jgi:proteasome lid subunit RPN8/RPN11
VSRKKKHAVADGSPDSRRPEGAAQSAASGGDHDPKDQIKTSGWVQADENALRKEFPDPSARGQPLRIAMTPEASAEVVSHAKSSLDAEVCGVLVGRMCEDDKGAWIWVSAAIRGDSARQGGAHVTYTQETWQKIHEVKDRDYADSAILGWYHSHPGFGVEFSAMDMFIQENFFGGPGQIALVLDPLSGDEAICVNTGEGIRQVPQFWVNGRPRRCRVASHEDTEPAGSGQGAGQDVARRLRAVEERLQQMLQATDDERAGRHHFRLALGMLVAVAIIFWIALTVSRVFFAREVPPEEFVYDTPVRIGDENVLLGVKVIKWKMPRKWQEDLVEAVKQQLEAEAKQRQEVETKRQAEAAAKEETAQGGKAPKDKQPTSGKGESGPTAKEPSKTSS